MKLFIAIVLVGSMAFMGVLATAQRQVFVNICHATSSETNPYNAIRVADDGNWNGHLDHIGDFLYNGPLSENGHPASDEWCEDQGNPEEPETPVIPEPCVSSGCDGSEAKQEGTMLPSVDEK